jgi:hypothetical protein
LTYYITKTESDSVAIIFVEEMLSMQKEGAAHRNTRDIAVHCTFMGSFNSQSTNIRVRCTCCLEVILFDVRFKNRGDLLPYCSSIKTSYLLIADV